MRRVNLFLPEEVHARFKEYAKSQNRSMQQQFEQIIDGVLNARRLAPVVKLTQPAPSLAAKPVVMVPKSDIRRIVRHELSYLMPDQYERRYGKGEPS